MRAIEQRGTEIMKPSPTTAEVCIAVDSLPLQQKREIFDAVGCMFPQRPKRWCYFHYKKAYRKAAYPQVLGKEEKKQLELEVRKQLALGRQLCEISKLVSKQEPFCLAFPNAVYAVVYQAWKKYHVQYCFNSVDVLSQVPDQE